MSETKKPTKRQLANRYRAAAKYIDDNPGRLTPGAYGDVHSILNGTGGFCAIGAYTVANSLNTGSEWPEAAPNNADRALSAER